MCNLLQVSATKQFSLERAPITLCIQLKRFSMMGNKLTKQITFKPRIDLSRFAARHSHPAAAAQPFSYRLVSMVTHLGVSQHCGHYTAIGLTEAGSYYNFDDSYVRPIAMQSVCNTNAYIMFYELDVANTHTPPKVNGLRLSNGQQHSPAAAATAVTSASIAATATSTATSSAASATASASAVSPRFIGPQLPNGYANGGHTLGSGASSAVAKTAIQFKTTPQKTPQQNGLLLGSSGSKHSVAGAVPKGEAAATATVTAANVNKSSCNNNNNNNLNSVKKQQHQQQRILPMSSDEDEDDDEEDEEEEESDEDHKVTPQLPSMPKMFEESSDSVAQTAKLKPKTPPLMKSLVPYESASEEEEQPQQLPASNPPAQLAANPRKRRSGADSSDDSDEEAAPPPTPSLRNGHAKTNGSLPSSSSSKASLKSASNASSAHVNSSKQKTDAIDEIFKSLTYKNKSKYRNTTTTTNNNDDDDEEKEKEQVERHKQQKQHQKLGTKSSSSSALSNGSWQSQNGGKSAPSSPKTPPSPAVIKSKTGIWQVTRTDEDDDDNDEADDDDDDDDDADDEVVVVEEPPKNHKNPFAASAATEANGAKRQKLLNGNAKTPSATPRIGNGYQSESVGNGAVVSELLKQSHRGYGTSVLTWSGKTSELDKEVSVSALFALPLSVSLNARFL